MQYQGRILRQYDGLRENQLNMSFDKSNLNFIQARINSINDIIAKEKSDLYLSKKSELELTLEEANSLGEKIKSNPSWENSYLELLSLYPHILPQTTEEFKEQKNALTLPWWNSQISNIYSCNMGLCLNIHFILGHSYLAQLARQKIIYWDSPSISGITISNDNDIILGMRGGHFANNHIMTIPAGSCELESLFESHYREVYEELKLKKEDFKSVKLIGRVFDYSLAFNSLFIFEGNTSLSSNEIIHNWTQAKDKREHIDLILIKNNPNDLANYMIRNSSVILIPGILSLLSYGRFKFGDFWSTEVEKQLGEKKILIR